MKIACSGYVNSSTGIGVVQRHLYPRLQSLGNELLLTPTRDKGSGYLNRAKGLAAGLGASGKSADAFLSVVPPFPLVTGVPTVSIVHDLRWLRVRSRAAQFYRGVDLRRTVQNSDKVICISERTKSDLMSFCSNAEGKAVVSLEGPGIVAEPNFDDRSGRTLLLMGGAPHKRNELAADVVLELAGQFDGIIGVGVSEYVKSRLNPLYGENARWVAHISDEELTSIYRQSHSFLFLGVEEGFGLPYIEALASGCEVIAIRQPLTEELLGSAATLVNDGSASEIAEQIRLAVPREKALRSIQAAKYSWDRFAEDVYDELVSVSEVG